MNLVEIDKRLYWAAFALTVYVVLISAVQVWAAEYAAEKRNYSAAVATLPGRFHEPMSFYELDHLAKELKSLEAGGDLSSLGLVGQYPPLADVLGEDRFDMASTLAVVEDKRARPARAKVELLVAKVNRNQARRDKFFSYLPWLSILGAALLLAYLSWVFWRTKSKLEDNIGSAEVQSNESATDQALPEYLQKVVAEEVAFTGFRAELLCHGLDQVSLPEELIDVVENTAEQLVRNSIEHGGRAADQRLMAGKAESLQIDVGLTETDTEFKLVVRDDGEGIDETDVLLRAVKLELINPEQAREVVKGQGIKYIFMPGYSGEKQAFGVAENSISLDRIRRKVKRSGGSISLQNLPGSFCQFSVSFPKRTV